MGPDERAMSQAPGRLDRPRHVSTSDPDSTPDPGSTRAPGRGRILVIEDNAVNQLVAVGVLEGFGYTVVLAEDGAAGVSAVAKDLTGFTAILMDCQMPVMDGYDATRAIRAMTSNRPRLPIIAMTAGAETEERQRCLDSGMDDYLLKPVDVVLLGKTLDRWILSPETATATAAEPSVRLSPRLGDPPEDLGVLDRSRLLELLESGAADLALLFKILNRFGTRADDAVLDLAAAVRADDPDEVSRVAHSLRGGAANVGLVRLAERCEAIELKANRGVLPPASTLFEIEDEVVAGVAQLASFARDMTRDLALAEEALLRDASSPS